MTKFLCSKLVGPIKLALLIACVASATCLRPIASFVMGEYARSVNRKASVGEAHITISFPVPSDAETTTLATKISVIDGVQEVTPALSLRMILSIHAFQKTRGDHEVPRVSVECIGIARKNWLSVAFDDDGGHVFLPDSLVPPLERMSRTSKNSTAVILIPYSLLEKVKNEIHPSGNNLRLFRYDSDGHLLPEKVVTSAGVYKGGAFSAGSETYRPLMWRLDELRDFANTNSELNTVQVRLKSPSDVDAIAKQIRKILPAGSTLQTWREREGGGLIFLFAIELLINSVLFFILGISLVAVYTAMRMIFDDRIAEFGTLKALGCSTIKLLRVLLRLGTIIGGMGALIGSLLGWCFAYYVQHLLATTMKESIDTGKYDLLLACVLCGLQIWAASIIAVIIAGWTVLKLEPATLLQNE